MANVFQRIASDVKDQYDTWKKRKKIWELQQDPEWALQAGLGDMEFEQDMYDDIMEYDRPYEGEPLVDKVALEGLRKHSKEGLNRYADTMPLREKKDWWRDILMRNERVPEELIKSMHTDLGSYNPLAEVYSESERDEYGLPENVIDINLLNILKHTPEMDELALQYEGYKGSLQDKISDLYRHEYKHAAGKDLSPDTDDVKHP